MPKGQKTYTLDVKQDYRHIIRQIPNTLVFRPSQNERNSALIFTPLYTSYNLASLIQHFPDCIGESFTVYDGTENYFRYHQCNLYKKYQTEKTGKFPTMKEFHNEILFDRPRLIERNARYRESALNRMPLINLSLGTGIYYRKGYEIGRLLENHNIIIELDALSHSARVCLTTLILSQVFQARIETRTGLPIIAIIDEAADIFPRELERRRGFLTISQLARQAREFNIGIIASCQIPMSLSDTILNAYTTVLFNLPEGKNLEYMVKSMQLSDEQKVINSQFQTGQAIIKIPRIPSPLPIMIPLYQIEKNVTDSEIEIHMEQFIQELRSQVEKQEPPKTKTNQQTQKKDQEDKKQETEKIENSDKKISEDEKAFLMSIYLNPYVSVTQHYTNLKWSAGKGNRMLKLVLRNQLCTLEIINLGGRGGLTKIPVLTEAGYQVIGMEPKPGISRGGGFEHGFWQYKISEHLKSLQN